MLEEGEDDVKQGWGGGSACMTTAKHVSDLVKQRAAVVDGKDTASLLLIVVGKPKIIYKCLAYGMDKIHHIYAK